MAWDSKKLSLGFLEMKGNHHEKQGGTEHILHGNLDERGESADKAVENVRGKLLASLVLCLLSDLVLSFIWAYQSTYIL